MKKHIKMPLPCRKAVFFLVLILQLVTCPLTGQALQKKHLTPADYKKWEELYPEKISPDGNWVSYTVYRQDGANTLFLKNTASSKKYSFALGQRGNFISSDWFAYKTEKCLHLIDLKTGAQKKIDGVIKHFHLPSIHKIAILKEEITKEKTLSIQSPDGKREYHITGVEDFVSAPTKRLLLYTSKNGSQCSINLLDPATERNTVLCTTAGTFDNLTWQREGNALAFTEKTDADPGCQLFLYDIPNAKLHRSNRQTQQIFLGDTLAIPKASYKVQISKDMKSVFFGLQRKERPNAPNKRENVQLWNANAKWIYPTEEKQKKFEGVYLGLWHPQEDRYRLVSNDSLPQAMLSGDQKHAVISNTRQYEPQYMREGPRDYYLLDLASGKKELMLKKHSDFFLYTIPSPTGKYIAYFQEGGWCIYDIQKKTSTNITKNMGESFSHNKSEHPNAEESYPLLGFTPLDHEIVLCDEYDIWAVTPDGISARRLTRGRETKTRFRLAGYSRIIAGRLNYDGWILDPINLDKELLLEASDKDGGSGYYCWSGGSMEKLAYSHNSNLSLMAKASSANAYMYMEQNYELPPRLMVKRSRKQGPKLIFQSNLQQESFYWGKAKIIHYKNSAGDSLKGILYYPADFDPQKKYPMIVHVYEKFSDKIHTYVSPSESDAEGFNISAYTTQGYFVLLPDIAYQKGNPGLSAADCVIAVTQEVMKSGLIQENKIGLIGHSFGGYEANFIITQTPLFAAAVSGSGISDLTSHYLSVGLFGKPLMWLFENHQFRMGSSLFENREGYRKNSPIEYAENCTTPLLSWTGDADENVNWNQSREYYLALRRLGKANIMLVYSGEGHDLASYENQLDLSERIHQWFDYHLKGVPPANWIKKGLQ
ncbi:alpha/beta hydrolase family protein [Flavobacterium tistrianum]|uniref:alpha/beta hydrolase family protein n=1 Tax=Flavobacterium tistrianum TaxID=1685414 RepID=UPI000DABCBD6|nr:prolyl oligopeptidase family serine peptidase [Flavobacterium tistrianum]KAF2342901.1 S9 family peptidase [Flavobacterium tistrianum]